MLGAVDLINPNDAARARRKLLMVARTRYSLPLSPSLARKFDALATELELRVLAASGEGTAGDPRFRLVPPGRLRRLDGPLFYARLPFRAARELRSFRPDAVLVQGSQETALVLLGRVLSRVPASVIADVHADPTTPTRLYGSRLRKTLAPLADLLARQGLRCADGVRTLSDFTSRIVREVGATPTTSFPAYMDLEPFLESPPAPLPDPPAAIFVGVLERYKGVDVLADAWRLVVQRVPEAQLHLVGRGSLRDVVTRLVEDLPRHTRWTERLPTEAVARALDEATVLVLPSRSEGLPRIVVEASCRGRAIVGSRVGGIPDLISDAENGVLVSPEDPQSLADALVRALSDDSLAQSLGATARMAVEPWLATPQEYARRVRDLVETVVRQKEPRSSPGTVERKLARLRDVA